MSGRFLITGLPRSRTAWFAVATMTQHSICYHEPTAHVQSFEELTEFWKPALGVSVGVADSALALQTGRILEELKPRTLIIERPAHDCVASFADYMRGTGIPIDRQRLQYDAGTALMELARHKRHPLVKTVSYEALSDYSTVLGCLRWLLPDEGFPDLKFLMGMNIQAQRDLALMQAAKPHSGWHRNVSREPV